MKLQLDKKDLTCMYLEVTGPVNRADVEVLRAGFRKLLGTARYTFLIDITNATVEADAELPLLAVQSDATSGNIRLVIIGALPRICQAKTIDEAEILLTAVVRLNKVLLPQLQDLMKSLQIRRDKAQSHINFHPEEDPVKLTAANDKLKARVVVLETLVGELMKTHDAPKIPQELDEERKGVARRALKLIEERGIELSRGGQS